MTIFVVETYVVKPEKLADFKAYKEKWKKFFSKWLKEVKSYKIFAQFLGGNWGRYVEMWESENLANCEKFFDKIMQSDYVTKLYRVCRSYSARYILDKRMESFRVSQGQKSYQPNSTFSNFMPLRVNRTQFVSDFPEKLPSRFYVCFCLNSLTF